MKRVAERFNLSVKTGNGMLDGISSKQLTEDELRPIVEEGVKAVGATSMKDMGKVMEYVMPKVKGRADGKAVSMIAKSLFN